MFRKLRRRWAHKSIRKFLADLLPKIGLGDLVEFKCLDFKFGDYLVKTTKGTYNLYFWELLYGAKEIYLDLYERENDIWERITFSITGNIKFKIVPSEFTIDRDGKRQVTNLLNGGSIIYPLGKNEWDEDFETCSYRWPVKSSEVVDLSKFLMISKYI